MSLPHWPEAVPHVVERGSYRERETHVPPHETEFDGGAVRRRPSSTVRRRLVALSWVWNQSQYDAFKTFYHTALVDGSRRFMMPDFLISIDPQLLPCQFSGMYAPVPLASGVWRVAALLYVFGD